MPDIIRALTGRICTILLNLLAVLGPHEVRIGRDTWILGHGRLQPPLAGGAGDVDDDPADDDDPPAADPPPVDPPADDDDTDDDLEDDDWDRERGLRGIRSAREDRRKERERRKAAEARAQAAEARANELEQAQLTEQERVVLDRDAARASEQLARDRATHLLIDAALRDAALEQGIEPRKLKRAVRFADRTDIIVSGDIGEEEVDGAEDAIADLLKDFPELKAAVKPDDDDDPAPDPEPPGGAPDRKRKPKQLTAAAVAKLARENPDEFNRLYESGTLTPEQLGG